MKNNGAAGAMKEQEGRRAGTPRVKIIEEKFLPLRKLVTTSEPGTRLRIMFSLKYIK